MDFITVESRIVRSVAMSVSGRGKSVRLAGYVVKACETRLTGNRKISEHALEGADGYRLGTVF